MRIRRLIIAEKRCVVLKYKHDTRYSANSMSTHDSSQMAAIPCESVGEVEHLLDDYDIIGIDEGQFFPDIREKAERLADMGKTVIIAALDGTF